VARFNYIASTTTGESQRGVLEATDKSDLARKLREKGLFLVSFRLDGASLSGTAAPATGLTVKRGGTPALLQAPGASASSGGSAGKTDKNTGPEKGSFFDALKKKFQPPAPVESGAVIPSAKGKVALKELVVLTRQISISINAGMSFVEALQSLAANARNPKLAYVLRHVLDDILAGKRFSDALANHPDVFKPVYVSMAAAGEAGGFMPEALNRTSEFLEKEIELKAKIKSAMAYPVVIGVVASVVVIGMMVFIVPTFIKVFTEMNAPLPGPTIALVAVSDFTRHGGFLIPFVFVGIILAAKKYRTKNERFKEWWDEKILDIPMFGKLMTLEIITRFIRTLASLVGNGVMALQAISVSRQVVENRAIEKVVDEIFSSVQQGNGISAVLYRSKHFPVLVANMVSTGEKTGTIPEVLNKMADYYDSEVSSTIRDLLSLMEPLLIVVMAVIVGFVILGLMLPALQMSQYVGN